MNPSGSRGVTQGGPQDIALFREIVERGEIPDPETLDPIGFFAEHALDLPPADCGQDICVHPSLAVAPRFDGGNWTMAFVAMNTPVDPETLERPPVHVVLVLERTPWSETMWPALGGAMGALVGALRDGDVVSVVAFASFARTIVRGVPKDDLDIPAALADAGNLPRTDWTGLYEGIATAGRVASALDGYAKRLLLVTSGRASTGITDPARIVGLGEALAREGTALGVVGIGDDYEAAIPAALGDLGAGAYYYAQDETDLARIFALEGETTLYPLAIDYELVVEAAPGYRVGRVYGARRATVEAGRARLYSPALFLGHRTGSEDVAGGRRGGGGGLFVELLAQDGMDIGADELAFRVATSWENGFTRELESSERTVPNSLPPGRNPGTMWVELSDPDRPQHFMMLNMYLGLRTTVEFFHEGDCARAKGLIDMMVPTIEQWQDEYDDADTQADWDLMMMLRSNLDDVCAAMDPSRAEPIRPQRFGGGCMVS